MLNENKFKYAIIIPVHNEEKHIKNALNSVVQQTYLPKEVIVVNDNSTDLTEKIVSEFIVNFPFIQIIHSGSNSTQHEPGNKIVNAFYKGFERLNCDWDVIVKLDADVILPENYFEEITNEFQSNPKVGIAGGLAMIEENGVWQYEKIGNKKQVRGPFKAYSKACFQQIGGLKKSIGWDTIDELLAQFHGFEIKVRTDLYVKLQKPTGKNYKNTHNQKAGQGFYKMDYGWIISFIAALKLAWSKKSFNSFILSYKGFLTSQLNADQKLVTKEEGRFIRKLRWKGILKKLINHS